MEVIVRNAEFITYKNDSAAKTEGTFTPSVEQDYEEYAYDPSEEF